MNDGAKNNGFTAFHKFLCMAAGMFFAGVLAFMWIAGLMDAKIKPVENRMDKIEEMQRTIIYGSIPEFDFPPIPKPRRRWLHRGKSSKWVDIEDDG